MSTLSIVTSASVQSKITRINVMNILQLWMDRHAQRKQLAQLSDHQLNDIGLTHQAALAQANLPFWK